MNAQSPSSFADPAVQRCPFPFIEQLHAESPVYRDPITGFFVVTRYADVALVNADPALFSNKTTLLISKAHSPNAAEIERRFRENGFPRIHTLVSNDPPDHGRYRAVVDKVFAPSFVRSLEPGIVEIADALIDALPESGAADLLHEYSLKIPMFVICDQLGVPREMWRKFKAWSDAEIEMINPALDPVRELELADLLIEAQNYLYDRAREYQQQPANKLLSLVANSEVDGRPIAPAEIVAIAEQLLVAGNETTTSAIAIALSKLIEDPELAQTLRGQPDKIGTYCEEILRLHAPSPHLYREVLADTEIGGVALPKGAIVQVSYLAANRDEAQFACPSKLDLDRKGAKNHLAFGRGIHFCIGNQLARTEMRIAVGRLLARVDGLAFDPEKPRPQFAALYHVHTLDSLDVTYTARR
ncbi:MULTISPECIES: cytochrome P450 [unclassified Novosphingobium]|uniref:cytochrome P450 n=1 Tax=unclassified Novosphingobium TaxID=2644732 RepID=UPI001357899E|nr:MULTISPECIES: cytochrome P450 [unclassified Novosphingobium]